MIITLMKKPMFPAHGVCSICGKSIVTQQAFEEIGIAAGIDLGAFYYPDQITFYDAAMEIGLYNIVAFMDQFYTKYELNHNGYIVNFPSWDSMRWICRNCYTEIMHKLLTILGSMYPSSIAPSTLNHTRHLLSMRFVEAMVESMHLETPITSLYNYNWELLVWFYLNKNK